MQTYETIFITTPILTEDEERTAVGTLAGIVTDGGGTMVANERMGRRRLAYPISKHNDGVYIRFLYDAEDAVPKELERRIRISDDILRVLTVYLEPRWADHQKKQAVIDAQARADAAEREKQEAEEAARLAAAAPPPAEEAPATEAPAAEAPAAEAPSAETPAAEPAAPAGEES